MKYSEYLKLVKARLPQRAPNTFMGSICNANSGAMTFDASREALRHYERLDSAINTELERLEKVTGCTHLALYPGLLALERGVVDHWSKVEKLDLGWRQQVRHELLDKWIAEAQAEEAS